MVGELLLEIGTEEIPSGYLEAGTKELRRLARDCLSENRIESAGDIYTFGTPRRLVIIGKAISETQQDLIQEIIGPPKNVAYDQEGRPTKAATGFAQKQGVSVDDLNCIQTQKGEYLYIKRTIPGRKTIDILCEVLPVNHRKDPLAQINAVGRNRFPLCSSYPLDPGPVQWPGDPF